MNKVQLLFSAIGISLVTAAAISVPRQYSFNADYVKFRMSMQRKKRRNTKALQLTTEKLPPTKLPVKLTIRMCRPQQRRLTLCLILLLRSQGLSII